MPDSFVSLMYHNVVPGDDVAAARAATAGLSPSITSYFVGATQFATHLEAITRVADVMTFSDLRAFYDGANGRHGGRPQVLLTFDDGWRGSVDVAGPLLAARGLQTLLFVTTGLIDRPNFLTATDLARLPRETFHVGSHTATHPFLNELDDAAIADELRRSKAELEDILGDEVESLSIPNGAADDRVLRIAAESGYRFVCVSSVHRNTVRRGPLEIGRAAIRAATTGETVARYAGGNLNREWLRSALLALPKHALGATRYRRLRGSILGEETDAQEMCDLMRVTVELRGDAGGRLADVSRSVSHRVFSSGAKR